MFIYETTGLLIYTCVMTFLIGAVLGSFLNCAAWRIAHGESFLKGRSHCTSCGHTLGAADLVPVFSWLFLKGKCRYCGTKIPARYPLTELVMALLCLSCVLRWGLSLLALRNLILLCCLFCLSLVDLEIYEIPNSCLLIAAAAWLLYVPFSQTTVREALLQLLAMAVYGGGMLLFSLLFDRILKKDTLGGGDIKLFGLMGLYLGLLPSLFALLLSCLIGLLFYVICLRGRKGAMIPFGPSIAASLWLMLLAGEAFVGWYLGLMGL